MRLLTVAIGVAAITFTPSTGHAESLAEGVSVAVAPATGDVILGESLDITVEVTNRGVDALDGLVVHIDITSLDDAGSVDPEDWTSTLSKPVGALAADGTATVDWRIQPISAGTFSLYAVVLAPGDDTVAASNVLRVSVDDRRSLDPNGILTPGKIFP